MDYLNSFSTLNPNRSSDQSDLSDTSDWSDWSDERFGFKPIDYPHYVSNTEMVDLLQPPTGITSVGEKIAPKEMERYDLQGERLNVPTRGINIVRYSDGTICKEIVK